jgi:FAD/FMN-containing dehydrogenase
MPLLKTGSSAILKQRLMPDASRRHHLRRLPGKTGRIVNDVHSQLNRTRVCRVVQPESIEALRSLIKEARARGRTVSIAGGMHAMGGQQFGHDAMLVDMARMNRVLKLDTERREVEVEAGIQWPELIRSLIEMQRGSKAQLGIIQKQTGADRLSLGGALAANIHGRGLTLKPIINDVESFVIIDAEGRARRCSRTETRNSFIWLSAATGCSASLRASPCDSRRAEHWSAWSSWPNSATPCTHLRGGLKMGISTAISSL